MNILNKNHLLFDRYFGEGETCCIAANPGVGKTFLACQVAKHPSIKMNAYFEFDDGYNQKERFEQVSSINPIYRPEFDQKKKELWKNAGQKCYIRAIDEIVNKFPEKIESKRIKLMKQIGIDTSIKVDELLLFQKYVEEAIENGANLITLDTLSSIVDFSWEITREYVKNISQLCRKNRISFLILQHTTKQGIYSGTSGLAQIVDTFLYLEDLGGNLRRLIVEKARFEKDKTNLTLQMISEGDHSVRFEVCENHKVKFNQYFTPQEEMILDVLGDNDTIEINVLMDTLGAKNRTSIKGSLLSLERKGYLRKFDGKKWAIITNCRKQN